MAMKGHIPGGGIASNKVTERPVRTGAGAKGINPGWVGQRGQKQGAHITNKGRDTGYHGEPRSAGPGFNPTKYGNEVALNVGKGGPGTGRTLYGQSGSQKQYGSGGPQKPAGRDILSSFGPDYKQRS